MSEGQKGTKITRDEVHNYVPGVASELPLGDGEVVQQVFTSDKRRYWADHAAFGAIGIAGVILILPFFGKAGDIPAGIAAVVLALLARGAFLFSEQMARRWQLTDRRLIGPQGRQVMLLEIKTLRRLMGDVQIVSIDGSKHLIKHLADGQAAIDAIQTAKSARAAV